MRLRAAVLTLTLCAAGCSSIIGRGSWDPFTPLSQNRVHIVVRNETLGSVTVRALSAGRRVNLGRIEGTARNNFSIPWSSAQDIRFQIELLGGSTHTTAGTLVHPGDQVEILVRDPVQRTTVRR
jgi:hypothetical protein